MRHAISTSNVCYRGEVPGRGLEPLIKSRTFEDSLGRVKMDVKKCACTSIDVMTLFMTYGKHS